MNELGVATSTGLISLNGRTVDLMSESPPEQKTEMWLQEALGRPTVKVEQGKHQSEVAAWLDSLSVPKELWKADDPDPLIRMAVAFGANEEFITRWSGLAQLLHRDER